MDYKQHKGNLRGKIKDKVERKLYNKQIRADGKNVDTSDGQLTIPDVINLVCRMCNSEVYKNDDGQFVCCKCGYIQ